MNASLGRFGNGPRVATIAGIDIRVDWSWLLVAAMVLFNFTALLHAQGAGLFLSLFGSILAIGLFFGTILLHELAHALVARQGGIGTRAITLHVLGGMAQLTGEPRSGRQEMAIAGAGPAANLAMGGVLGTLALLIPNGIGGPLAALDTVVFWAAAANLFLGVTNLLPAFPLDGGRVLRGHLWHKYGSWSEGTRRTARAGRIVAWFLVAIGTWVFLNGDVISALMIGFFAFLMLQTSKSEEMRAAFSGDAPDSFQDGRVPFDALFRRGPAPRGPRVVRQVRYPDGRVVEILER